MDSIWHILEGWAGWLESSSPPIFDVRAVCYSDTVSLSSQEGNTPAPVDLIE